MVTANCAEPASVRSRDDLIAEGQEGSLPSGIDVRAAFFEHGDRVRRFAARLGLSQSDADDVASEVFLVAHTRREAFQAGRAVLPWLFGIAIRIARRHRRRAWMHSVLATALSRDAPVAEVAPRAEETLVAAEDAARVRRVLDAMPDRKRALLVMREYEGLSAEQIGEALGVPVGTVYSSLHHARKELVRRYRQQLTVEGVR